MLKNLSVKTKLKMYFFGLTFFIILVSSSAIFSISKIENSAQDLYSYPYQVSVASIKTESEINHIFSAMQVMANSEDQNIISAQIELIEEIELRIENNIEILNQFYLGDENNVSELEESYLESKTNRGIVIDYLKNSEFDSAKEFMVTNGGVQKVLLLEKLDIIQLFASNKADELNENALEQASLYTYLIIGFSTIIIVSSIGLVVYIIRDLVPPLEKLLKTIDSYKKDENINVLDLERQDELGIIGNSFSEMLDYMKSKQEMQQLDMKLSKLKSTEELHKTQLLLNASLESPKDIIILSLDTEYKYMFFNKAHSASMKLAYNADVTNGMCIFDFMSSKDDIKRVKENYDRALSGETHTTREQYGDLEKSYFEIVFSPVINDQKEIIGVSSFARDITEMTNANIKQKESEEKYKLLNDMMPLGMVHYQVVFDEKNKKNKYQFIGTNKTFENQVGMKNSDLFGKNLTDVFPKTEQYWLDNFDEVISTRNPIIFENFSVELDSYMKISVYTIKSDILAVVTEDVTEVRRNQNEINYLSYHDSLTDLYNRRFFEEEMKRLDNKRNLPISVIMGDVNGLKLTNDAFGHQAGDKLLKIIGNIISASIRGNDIASRWGGDEFTILLPNSDSDAANILIKRIQSKIKEASFEYGSLSISFGVDTKKGELEDINKIFTNAEEFMYQNKLAEIDSMRGQTISTIMTTLFEKSPEVKEHSTRVSELAFLIAEKMELSKTNTNDIKTMGLIHDIGKIVIDLQILDKPGKLNDEERKLIEQHPLSGSRMLNSSHEYSRLAAGVLHHHERIDGTGYPNGIKGNQIPIESRIIAVADAYDAMTAERPYRLNPLTMDQAILELQKHSGSQFDETVVDVFVNKVLPKNIK